ncbi:MAG: PAS domain S-box protein [Methanoregula sp.]|uniref:PAS domain S-box protein n=1 Tax=Methanoregula sp. TaxID=2052170 RepID=UPI003BAE921C
MISSILYVDDEASLLEVGKLFLERSGQFPVDVITSAPAALELLKTGNYDAIVSDYQMPEMDGIAFLKKVRSSGNTIPFILFTGRGREEIAIQALNQGADFYLQKGGEPVSQFTELEHQIRHAVQQRRAEASIRDHEQREADIINFLPDATFAIDTDGVVIAWNHAIEEMTGVSAAEILGKGDYEYAIPFYGKRQPILIDLIFESDEVISQKYEHIIHEKNTLIADTTHPFPKGKTITLMGMASPLYNRQGKVIGVIESIRDITERKLGDDAIRESEQRYRNVVEDQIELISRFRPDGTHVFVNEAYCRYFGLNRDEIIGKRFLPDIPPEDRERVRQFFASLTPDHPIDSIEHRIIMKDGTVRWQQWSDRAIFDPSGSVTEYQSVGLDITEKKATEAALAESEARFREQYQNNPLAIFTWQHRNGDFVLADYNKAAETLTSGRSHDYLGRSASDLYAHRPELLSEIRKCFSDRTVISMDLVSEHFLPGRLIHTTASFAPPDLIMVHMEDISEHVQAEAALRESEAKYRGIFAAESDGIAVVDQKTGTIIDYNDALSVMHGYQKDELLGLPITTLSAESDATSTAITEETPYIRDRFHKRKDGSVFPVDITVNAMPLQGRKVLIGAIRDLTEHRRSEEALRQANRSLALLTNVTRHDISNQLVALNGFLELLHEKVRNPALEDYFKWISQVSTRINSMIQFASAYETVRKTDPVWQDIRMLAETATRQVSLGNVTVKNEIPTGAEVFADPLIVKVFYNLVDNAIRYGGKISIIRFSLVDRDGHGIIVCEDDGVGISDENKEKIFDRGFGKNTGLGLFLSREILSLTGITIHETGEPGKGVRFEIKLPNGAYRFANTP